MVPLWIYSLLTTILTFLLVGTGEGVPTSLAILYNSNGGDGDFQKRLLKGIVLGFRDSTLDSSILPQPLILDSNVSNLERSVDWIISNGTTTIISLLSPRQLKGFCHYFPTHKLERKVYIFTPRSVEDECGDSSEFTQIMSLEMSQDGRIMALLHRIMKIGTLTLLPLLEDTNQLTLLQKYKETGFRIFPQLTFMSPVFMNSNSTWTSHPSFSIKKNSNLTNGESVLGQGILLLSSNALNREEIRKLGEEEHHFRWFTHEGFHEIEQSRENSPVGIMGLYTVQYVGGANWDNHHRRRLLKEFNEFTGPNPNIISVALAYDTARVAISHFLNLRSSNQGDSIHSYPTGLSGDIEFTKKGTRTQGVYFGIFTLPNGKRDSFSGVLEPSPWILEDVLEINEGNGVATFGEFHLATTSILSRNEIMTLGNKGNGMGNCGKIQLEILIPHPFNLIKYTYTFDEGTLPPHILIPNEYGYGLDFECSRRNSSGIIKRLKIACTPNRKSIHEPIQCFSSGGGKRSKRSHYSSPYSYRAIEPITSSHPKKFNRVSEDKPIEGASWTPYQHYPLNPNYKNYNYNGTNSVYSYVKGGRNHQPDGPMRKDHSVSGTKERDAEYRRIFKSAKPFLGSCIGTTTGCAVCMIVLRNFPVGAMPTACIPSCFLGGFGTCGGLLGRAISETTVICTQLFQQGLLDMDTFLADAEFGRRIAKESPKTLLGYQIIATPLVEHMKESGMLTRVVAYFALPWTRHMKYLIGDSEEFNWSGYFIHTIGTNICYIFGHICTCLNGVEFMGYSLLALSIPLIFSIIPLQNK